MRIAHTSRADSRGDGRGVAELSRKRGVGRQLSATLRETRGGRIGATCETAAATATR